MVLSNLLFPTSNWAYPATGPTMWLRQPDLEAEAGCSHETNDNMARNFTLHDAEDYRLS